MASLFIDVHLSKANLTLFLDGNCFLIASTVSEYSLRQMMLRVLADGSTSLLCNAFCDSRSSRFNIAFQGIWAETDPNLRKQFEVSWWNLSVTKSLDARLERVVCQCGRYWEDINVEYEYPFVNLLL